LLISISPYFFATLPLLRLRYACHYAAAADTLISAFADYYAAIAALMSFRCCLRFFAFSWLRYAILRYAAIYAIIAATAA